jgi:cation diffusion facilitator CzcD-associated flavoprotein CzcO
MAQKVSQDEQEKDVVVVGAGFAGMYMLHRLRKMGYQVRVIEAGSGVGGTWYWNRYPGARCDVESLEYSYSFDEALQQEWEWTERYSGQPEILKYANHVADRFDLRKDISFNTRVLSAVFNETTDKWVVESDSGESVTAKFFVMATGCLSSTNTPDMDGIDDFRGEVVHTGRWPKEGVDLAGKRVGIIGTGSSAVQAIPVIARECAELTVFQRTAQYTVPARNEKLDPVKVRETKDRYKEFRDENFAMPAALGASLPQSKESVHEASEQDRATSFESWWESGGTSFMRSYADLILDESANVYAAEFVRSKIEDIVTDPETARKLSPEHIIGCKRLVIDSGYYETFNRPNVHLVDVSEDNIERVTSEGLKTAANAYEVDVLIFATGFDAMTGSILKVDIRGRSNLSIRDKWSAGPRTYLGLSVPGFPNMFMVSGPGSPSVLTNMIVSIQQHVEWISDCIAWMDETAHKTIEATVSAETDWVEHVNVIAHKTLFPSCNSWYLGANVPGKTRVFMPLLGFPGYVRRCDKVASENYDGFTLVANG